MFACPAGMYYFAAVLLQARERHTAWHLFCSSHLPAPKTLVCTVQEPKTLVLRSDASLELHHLFMHETRSTEKEATQRLKCASVVALEGHNFGSPRLLDLKTLNPKP